MARNVSSFRLGLFILICGALGLVSIIWIGASHLFEKKTIYVTYFDETVKGLQRDAVVNYRGVAVGRVASITLAPDGHLIQVEMYLKPEFRVTESMAIQLRQLGLTGLRYLEIDTAPDKIDSLTPKIDFEPPAPLITSYPSEMEQLKAALETIYDKLYSLDLKALTDNWTKTSETINRILVHFEGAIDPQIWKDTVIAINKTATEAASFLERFSRAASQGGMEEGFHDLSATLESTRQASAILARQLKDLPPGTLSRITKNWEETVTSGGTMFSTVDRRVGESAVLFEQSLQQFKVLLTQLNGLIQAVKEQPNRLIFPSKPSNPFER